MARGTIKAGHLDMGGMREKDTDGLPGINIPRDLLSRLNVFADELGLFRVLTHCLFMAFYTVFQLRDAGKAPVLTEVMTAFTAFIYGLLMKLVIKIKGLLLFRIKDGWINDPSHKQKSHKAHHKAYNGEKKLPGPWLCGLGGFPGRGMGGGL